jgi:hypothetical protein
MTEFVAELPPSGGNWDATRQKQVEQFAADLKAHPGLWAVHPLPHTYQAARASASRISHGRTKAFARGYEAVTRNKVLYVRYAGE